MTLGVAWIRNTGDVREAVVASDSLLSAAGSAETWRACPKILSLPRTDAVISFAGVTEFAYPAILQIIQAISSHPDQVSRQYDLTYLSGFVEDLLNQIDSFARSEAKDSLMDSRKNTEFLLAGFSWRYARFRIWRYAWDPDQGKYTRRQCRAEQGSDGGLTCRFIGTHAAKGEAVGSLKDLMSERGAVTFDMEPFEVLTEIIRSGRYTDIGGAPQIVKVYRHLNTQFFNTAWSINGAKKDTYAGRPLLDFEKPTTPAIDPDNPSNFGKSSQPK